MNTSGKRVCIEQKHPGISVQQQCELLDLPRSSYYQQPAQQRETDENRSPMELIDKEYTHIPFMEVGRYGMFIADRGIRLTGNEFKDLCV